MEQVSFKTFDQLSLAAKLYRPGDQYQMAHTLNLGQNLKSIRQNDFKCEAPFCSIIDGVEVYEESIQLPWLKEVLHLDFVQLAQNSKVPMLFLYGTSDCVIPESEFGLVQDASKN